MGIFIFALSDNLKIVFFVFVSVPQYLSTEPRNNSSKLKFFLKNNLFFCFTTIYKYHYFRFYMVFTVFILLLPCTSKISRSQRAAPQKIHSLGTPPRQGCNFFIILLQKKPFRGLYSESHVGLYSSVGSAAPTMVLSVCPPHKG